MDCFYRGLAFVYLCSFTSLYTQFPGLYGWNGLLPIDQLLSRIIPTDSYQIITKIALFQKFPSLLLFAPELNVSVEAFAESLLLVGIFTSTICLLSTYNWAHFATLYIVYLSLLQAGQSFMSFQWDILLVEIGVLAAVSLTFPFKQYGGPDVAKLLFRFILWKLMFMAGVVKVFANCPTWLNLTALEYHFATQPLAHGLSWYAHQLHPVLLRAGVAITLLIEIPLSFFCIGHFRLVRQFGAIAQVLLQVLIMFTGNYNFFNLLTIILTIPVWIEDGSYKEKELKVLPAKIDTEFPVFEKKSKQITLNEKKCTRQTSTWMHYIIQLAVIINVVALVGGIMFEFKYLPEVAVASIAPDTSWAHVLNRVQLSYSTSMKVFLPKAVKYSGPIAVAAVFIKGLKLIITNAIHAPRLKSKYNSNNSKTAAVLIRVQDKTVWVYRMAHALFLVTFMGCYLYLSSEPLVQINSYTLANVLPIPTGLRQSIDGVVSKTRPFSVSSGYGLFRQMTGVDKSTVSAIGIGGLPPPVVSRPEIILEGYDEFTNVWKTIEFKYKPSDVMTQPPLAAPHQPRLDWQMWFAALGEYQREPWLVNLVDKLLLGGAHATDVIRGIDTKLSVINASMPTEEQAWWAQEKIREYLPPLDKGNPSVATFLSHSNLARRDYQSPEMKYAFCEQVGETASTTNSSIRRPVAGIIQTGFKRFICFSLKIRVWYDNAMLHMFGS